MENKHTEFLFGIPLFDWKTCDRFEDGVFCFYGVTWRFSSMERWNGFEVTLYTSCENAGSFSLSDEKSGEDVKCMQNILLLQIPEFKDAMLLKWFELKLAEEA
jgi:hypothetical protein